MLVTLTQFAFLAIDGNGNVMPLGENRIACEAKTAAGAFAALDASCKLVRLATDTAIQMDFAGGSTSAADELIPANTVEYISTDGGEVFTIAAA